jgi:hypothetical protein
MELQERLKELESYIQKYRALSEVRRAMSRDRIFMSRVTLILLFAFCAALSGGEPAPSEAVRSRARACE